MEPATPEVNMSTPGTSSTPEIKKDNHLITIVSMAAFVIVSLLAVAFLFYQNQKLKTMLAGYQGPIVLSPSPSATSDPTANWKTYTNNYWDITFKYPDSIFKPCLNYSTEKGGVRFWGPGFDCPEGHDILYKIGFLGYDLGKYTQYKRPFSVETIIIDGREAEKKVYKYDNSDGPLESSKQSIEIVFTLQNGVITLQQLGDNQQEQEAFTQILSTFKFLGASPSPEAKACTQEAKLCPNGTYVGRTGPNCEFAPCPTP